MGSARKVMMRLNERRKPISVAATEKIKTETGTDSFISQVKGSLFDFICRAKHLPHGDTGGTANSRHTKNQ